MKFVQNNKILVDSNAETAEISAEKAQLPLASLRFLCDLCVSALKKFFQLRQEADSVGNYGRGSDWSGRRLRSHFDTGMGFGENVPD